MATKIQMLGSTKFFQLVMYLLIRLYSMTFKLKVVNESPWLDHYLNHNGAILLCCYHQQFFSAINLFKKYEAYRPGLMISRSKDGEFIAGVARRSGWHTVRGSSSRGGRSALLAMIEHLKTHRLGAHIVDGPRGPAEKVKAGAIKMAHDAGAVVVPFYVTADRAWYFNSWDKFFIPKPFARVVLKYGDILEFPPVSSSDEFEKQRVELEETMSREYLGLAQK